MRVSTDGRITVNTGAVDIGQGLTTTLAQLVAEELGVTTDRVQVLCGDTARISHGVGTFASRGAVMAGNAVAAAAIQVRVKAVELAAHLLEVSTADVEWRDGCARVRRTAVRPSREMRTATCCGGSWQTARSCIGSAPMPSPPSEAGSPSASKPAWPIAFHAPAS